MITANWICQLQRKISCTAITQGQGIISYLTPVVMHALIKAWQIGSHANTHWCYESAAHRLNSSFLRCPRRSPLPKLMAQWETVRSWMSWPSTSCNKAPQDRPSRRGEEVSQQQPAVACTFSYWLSLYPQPLCGCQIPYSNLSAERGPLPCPLIPIFLSCLSFYHRYRLISLKRKWASASIEDVWKWNSRPSLSPRCQGSFWIV